MCQREIHVPTKDTWIFLWHRTRLMCQREIHVPTKESGASPLCKTHPSDTYSHTFTNRHFCKFPGTILAFREQKYVQMHAKRPQTCPKQHFETPDNPKMNQSAFQNKKTYKCPKKMIYKRMSTLIRSWSLSDEWPCDILCSQSDSEFHFWFPILNTVLFSYGCIQEKA